ncbi:MAG: GlsB/YeaQ/YmgE family stress response membrane protein [Acidimicrobiia bacterium]
MFNFWTVMYLIFIGLIAGYAARLLLKGDDSMTWWQTMLLGIVGSFIGGFGAYVLFGWDDDEGFFQPSGLIFSILGAIVALLIWRAIQSRTTPAGPGAAPRP